MKYAQISVGETPHRSRVAARILREDGQPLPQPARFHLAVKIPEALRVGVS